MTKEEHTFTFINYSSYRQAEDIKRLEFIASCIRQHKGDKSRILDIGCGNGNICFQLANEGYRVTAIDISAEAIEQAKLTHSHPNITYAVKSIEDFCPSTEFDIIVCSEVLEHLQTPFPILVKMESHLSKEGCLIITVPNGYGPREVLVTKPIQKIPHNQNSIGCKLIKRLKKSMGYTGITVQSRADNLSHLQFFTLNDIYQYTEELRMTITYKGGSNFIEKVFPFSLFAKHFTSLQKLDCKIADLIPLKWCSGFFFVLRKTETSLNNQGFSSEKQPIQ